MRGARGQSTRGLFSKQARRAGHSAGAPACVAEAATAWRRPGDSALPTRPDAAWGPFDFAQDKPFDYAQDKPFDYAQDKPFDYAQDKPFGFAQDKPFGFAQDKPRGLQPRPRCVTCYR